jgi:hypothetical protein
MKAYDNLSQQLDPKARIALIVLSDFIAETRRDIWNLEVKIGYEFFNRQSYLNQIGGPNPLNLGAAQAEARAIEIDLPALRVLKNRLEGYVQCRLSIAAESLPSCADTWWLSWEQHSDPIVTLYLPKNPWDQVVFSPGFLGPPDVIPAGTPTATPYRGCLPYTPGSAPGGNYIQSDFGNYEMVIQQGEKVVHYWRDNNDPNHAWHYGSEVPTGNNIVSQLMPVRTASPSFRMISRRAYIRTVTSRCSCTPP